MQSERTVSLSCVIAVVLWSATLALIFAGTIAGVTADGQVGHAIALSLMAHGLVCSAAAATVTIRNGQKEQNRLMRDAYTFGQETSGVRRVRS